MFINNLNLQGICSSTNYAIRNAFESINSILKLRIFFNTNYICLSFFPWRKLCKLILLCANAINCRLSINVLLSRNMFNKYWHFYSTLIKIITPSLPAFPGKMF